VQSGDHIGTVLMSLANLEGVQGHHAESLEYVDRALAAFEGALPADHPTLAYALQTRGVTLGFLGRGDEAEASLQRAVDIRLEAFGPGHPFVASTRFTMAQTQRALGRSAKARRVAAQALADLGTQTDTETMGDRSADLRAEIESWLAGLD
jgi:tetratricopeptide (TPR) repeat protein